MALPPSVPALISAVVATVCAVLAYAAWRALLRTGNPNIGYVVAAFALMAAKGIAKAFTLGVLDHEGPEIELLFTFVDVTVVALFAWPILRRRRPAA